ncbi:TolC family protein [Draconibacterium halophilum]|uniref:TolC family protein n=1 Tax=Draconibacterium halophilum TaxID=2706887 RepID=A0A6C0RE75_9BACT|nr:TolC family protein [Draconibacterium halophilum]QIA08367.1 TolC family protein [Draconibacterium halophilum]
MRGVRGVSNGNQVAQTLDSYLEIAAENNPGLQAQYKDFEAALQKVPQVSSLPDPTFSFGYFISPIETRVGPQRAKFSLSQMFPWFGTLEAKADAASLMADAKYQTFLDARNRLYYSVSEAYYPLIELKQLKAIEQENIEILQSYKTIANSKFKNGVSPMTDVLRVDIMLKEAQTNLGILNKKEKPLLATFNNLLNRNEGEAVVVQDSLFVETLPDNFRRDSLLTNNPLLDAIELKQQASEKSELVAQRQGLPKVGIGLDYAITGKRTDMDVEDNGKNAFMPMVSVSIPIFRKKYRAAETEAQLMQEKYSFQKEETINSLTSGYESVWFQLQQQKDLIELYEAQVLETEQTLNLLFSAYGNSGKDFEEVLRMQQQLLKYEKMKATAETQYQTALAKLNYITAKTY